MKTISTLWPALAACAIVAALFRPAAAMNDDCASSSPVLEHSPVVFSAVLPAPVRSVRLRTYLYRLADNLADAVFDRRELSGSRSIRLHKLADDVADAVESQGVDWRYAATLLWIGHRETRLCSVPRKLGNEDGGRAHGYFQVWAWKGRDPYSAATAMDMLVHDAGAWSLPAREPWTGYPEAAAWINAHPFVDAN